MNDRTSAEARNVTVITPGSITDIAKAVREAIAALRDIAKLVDDGVNLFDRRKDRTAAKNLSNFIFANAGSRQHLERLSAGVGTLADIEAIGQQMADTAGEVEDSILSLQSYYDHCRERYGLAAATKLQDIMLGPAGKRMIRYNLLEIVQAGRSEPPNLGHIQSAARQALQSIDYLNSQLIELHDLLLPPRRT